MLGPKCSGLLVVVSIWGIIFLGILGALYKNESIGLFEDLPNVMGEKDMKQLVVEDIKTLYKDAAIKCWIGAGIYGGILVLSGIRFFMLMR